MSKIATVPPWTLGWRLRRSLAFAGLTTEQIADELELSRGTISHWLNELSEPKRLYLREWATITGVPYEWLLEGDEPHGDSHGERPDATSQSFVFPDRQESLMARIGSLQLAS